MQHKYGILQNKNAIITGAASGIGYATVKVFAENGANIWACARTQNDEFEIYLTQLAEENHVWIRPVYFELTDNEQMKKTILKIKKEEDKIDILINNAGMAYDALLPMISMEKSYELFNVNFFAQLQFAQLVSRQMVRKKQGCIVNISSYLGFDGNRGQTIYSASKGAVNAMTKSLAKELADYGIRVNAVAPGYIQTAMTEVLSDKIKETVKEQIPLGKLGEAKDVANLVKFLSKEESSYITGQVIHVDGGMVM